MSFKGTLIVLGCGYLVPLFWVRSLLDIYTDRYAKNLLAAYVHRNIQMEEDEKEYQEIEKKRKGKIKHENSLTGFIMSYNLYI